MKKGIHAEYVVTSVKCSTCGHEFTVKSTMEKLPIESCNHCNTAYTGETKNKKAAGRVERFNKKFGL